MTETKTLYYKKIPIELILVKGGEFMMGSEKREEEQPIHKVSLPDFWIGKYPVLQQLWEAVMGENPAYFKGKDRPVDTVSWNDCQTFITKLNEEMSEWKFALPSEAQWEYAARGGTHHKEGFEYAGSNDVNEVAWYNGNSHKESKPVGLKKPNQLGIYDMSGNVREWCEDDCHNRYKGATKDGSAWVDKPRGTYRLLRGGSWDFYPDYCRVANRNFNNPASRFKPRLPLVCSPCSLAVGFTPTSFKLKRFWSGNSQRNVA
ncbi:MAG: formylglycine-generating enzyme family protein [Bernardetiaceae bacterium]|nr:formylglycine-generating enzyme family protein [Bernardetiaceae bacterium]